MWFPSAPAWIDLNLGMVVSKHIHYEVWDENYYPFPNFKGAAVIQMKSNDDTNTFHKEIPCMDVLYR